MPTKTLVAQLTCFRCERSYPASETAYVCPVCGSGDDDTDPGVLEVHYDYKAAAQHFREGQGRTFERADVFRYLPLLPVQQPGTVLPVGGTPLVSAPRLAKHLGLQSLYLKDETRNPTRCLKDRSTAIAITMALQQGKSEIYCASAGNAAISLAGFCAHTGQSCHVFVPHEVSSTRLAWLYRYGANVYVSSGNYDLAFSEAEHTGAKRGWYSRNCALNPYLVEGKKTVAFEIAEQLDWQIPDLVVAPVGDGCTLGAIGKGFREFKQIGLLNRLPQLLGVQSEAIQPLVSRYHQQPHHEKEGITLAASIAVRRPRNALRLLSELKQCGGWMVAVPDAELVAAQKLLAQEAGMVAELTSAATLAGLLELSATVSLSNKTVVLVITGGRLDGDS